MVDIVKTAQGLSDYESVRDFLYSLRYHGAKYGLDRVVKFSELMGRPEAKIPCIHVAGTNGKGSTCAMLEQIYRDKGFKTGLYSSPHLIRQGERIQVNRQILDESEIVRLTKTMVQKLLESGDYPAEEWPSFFEFMTVMGWTYFAEQKVDLSFIETGLGGRLDATNILQPKLCVITSISLDHTNILGDTIEQIAAEKAGILKAGVPVVIGMLPPAAEAVIRDQAQLKQVQVYSIRERFGDDLESFPTTNLSGEYQRINAATAWLSAEVLGKSNVDYGVSPVELKQSLLDVYWPGRWETVTLPGTPSKHLVLDATHNVEGAQMLRRNLENLCQASVKKPVVVMGSLGEDRARSLLEVVCQFSDRLFLVQASQPRALSHQQLRACIPEEYTGTIVDTSVDELFSYMDVNIELEAEQSLLVTGSIYLIGEVSDLLKSTPIANQQSLQDVV